MSTTPETLLKTPLHDRHLALGAKMVPYAGYDMPISYTSLREEHEAVRERVGMFDVSHMGEFVVKGEDALALVQRVTTNDAARLEIGQAQYSAFATPEGGIVDDLLVYRLAEDKCAAGERAYMLVVNASNIAKDWAWIERHAEGMDVRRVNISEQTALLAVQGPQAVEALQWFTTVKLHAMPSYTFVKTEFAGVGNVIVSATGYTGAGGFELYLPAERATEVWDAILAGGHVPTERRAELHVQPVGLGARDSLRLEMGYALYGNDIDLTTSTLEAGLAWVTKLDKGDFVGRDFLKQQKADGPRRRLVGLKVEGRRVARHGYPLFDAHDDRIGEVTSGSQSPTLGYPVALGYVPADMRAPGTEVFVGIGEKRVAATVVKPPFVSGR